MRELTSDLGADYVFVTVGSGPAVGQGFKMLRSRGTEVIVGIPAAGTTFPFPINHMVGSERRIMGSSMGATHLSVDVPRLIAQYQYGTLKLDELITAHYPIEEINEAIESMEQGHALRNAIMF